MMLLGKPRSPHKSCNHVINYKVDLQLLSGLIYAVSETKLKPQREYLVEILYTTKMKPRLALPAPQFGLYQSLIYINSNLHKL
jgi:hypothetical protein